MSQASTFNLQPLDKRLRGRLESTVKEAREVAEEAARAACRQLGVGRAKPDAHLTEDQKDLRRRLRIHGRQLGDKRDPKTETQQLDRLVEEIAYEHWHRMLFARFLAENNLLMYPDPDDPVPISLEECEDLAADEGAKNGWELAASFATKMLPQIFRIDSPVFSLTLPPEKQQRLEQLLSDLPAEVFTASDSLGWVYQFWQAKRKDEVNASEVKIGARELPAVTQLFTEPYMVSFLLDNSLGAWWAARRLTAEDLQNATSEQELREKASLPGVPLEYLRFVRVPVREAHGADQTHEAHQAPSPPADNSTITDGATTGGEGRGEGDSGDGDAPLGPWTPAAGTFDSWPESLAELKTLDPCCGSGHFLTAALLMLAPMRMELEGLSAREAVDRVLSENLHGLEIDQRCVELAAFALALAAWRFPDADGYRVLPDLNVACCGLSVSVTKGEWKALAKDNNKLKIALDWMYDEFKDAPVLGSLLNPAKSMAARVVEWDDMAPTLYRALNTDESEERREIAIVAHGLARSARLLSERYDWITTNVPYKKSGEMISAFGEFFASNYKSGRKALETAFFLRCIEFLNEGGIVSAVLPQNWAFLKSYEAFRRVVLNQTTLSLFARLGPGAFQEITGEVVKAVLFAVTKHVHGSDCSFAGFDASPIDSPEEKAIALASQKVGMHLQTNQLSNPDLRIAIDEISDFPLLGELVETGKGSCTFDSLRFIFKFFEHSVIDHHVFMYCQGTVDESLAHEGRTNLLLWEEGKGQLAEMMAAKEELEGYSSGAWYVWSRFIGRPGVLVSLMGNLSSTLYGRLAFDNNAGAIVPRDPNNLPAIWRYCSSKAFNGDLRKIDQKLNVTDGTLAKVPFDLAHWQQVASKKYPHGLPEPYSDDPTQWIFHGHPASALTPKPSRTGKAELGLQVAVARLLGYRWPAELDAEMELATDARAWVERSSQLTDLADKDGIVSIPAVGTEPPAEDRLLNLLHRAYEDGRVQEQVFREKLAAGDASDPLALDLLRRGYGTQAPSPQPSPPNGSRQNETEGNAFRANHSGERGPSRLADSFDEGQSCLASSDEAPGCLPDSFGESLDSLLEAADHRGKTLHSWIRDKFFTQHCKLFHHRPFIWHIWDGLKDGFSVLVNYHKLDNKLLETLIYNYLGNWINTQKNGLGKVDGSQERLDAAESLKRRLEKILEGEAPHDIFVRWKPLDQQPIGWNPDLNDGVRLNIRPFMTVGDVKKKGAGILRDKPNIKWGKDRGKDVESAPWYHLGPEYGGKVGDRINDHHLTLETKNTVRKRAELQ